MTRDEVIKIIEELGFVKNCESLMMNNNSYSNGNDDWYTLDGGVNYAIRVFYSRMVIWNKPYLYVDVKTGDLLDNSGLHRIAFNEMEYYEFNDMTSSSLRDVLMILVARAEEMQKAYGQKRKEERFRQIEEL